MKTLRILLYTFIMGLFSSQAMADTVPAADQTTAKRPATDDECDPSNWSSNADINYAICEEKQQSTHGM